MNDAKNVRRNMNIDSLKGIGIVLMVMVHAGGPFSHFINLFHMPLFFICSGYLWNYEKINSQNGLARYIVGKIHTLWKPFVLLNGGLVLLHNFLLEIGLYTSDPQIFEIASIDTNKVQLSLSLKEILTAFIKTVFFAHTSQLGAPTWFLRTLFIVVIVYALISIVDRHINNHNIVQFIAIILFAVIATILSVRKIVLPVGVNTFFSSYLLYGIGVYLRKGYFQKLFLQEERGINHILVAIVCALILIIANQFGTVAMASGMITNAVFFMIVSVAGYVLVYTISIVIPIRLKRAFVYIGQHSIMILLLHLLAFKLISWLYVVIANKPMIYLAVFPSIRNVDCLWVLYTISGIAIPLLFQWIFRKISTVCHSDV